ncbi:hypothetical protein [Rickettsiales endosymbiont of Stachyamoeba lipophora]|uniref:hypothetical protein n=1 Tax=Rickettsiales endosymbiont of Stachyamoeba lipophora TaxID=2486578 RepID=UPI000F651F66|nr:hypothetical protein [Rickettsiales endosymbiont of Stachyamoeba lipophora]AZL16389.1 hypothetical protein EF513_07620 [Rickettsiales endosymbiont of Stachyamoeba lipophora]
MSTIFSNLDEQFKNHTITKDSIYSVACQYYMAITKVLPKELQNPGSQGYITWAALNNYLIKNITQNDNIKNIPKEVMDYINDISIKVKICRDKLEKDCNSQVSGDLKPLNLFSINNMNNTMQNDLILELQKKDCIDKSKILKGEWVLLYREDGRFFVMQNNPQKHLTDFVPKELGLEKNALGIAKPHLTVNEGQGIESKERLEKDNYIFAKLDTDSSIIKDNGIDIDHKKPYYLVKDSKAQLVIFSDLTLGKVSFINNPQPRVEMVCSFGVSSNQLEDWKKQFEVYPINRNVTPHISLGQKSRKLEEELKEDKVDSLYPNLNNQDRELLKKMLQKNIEAYKPR